MKKNKDCFVILRIDSELKKKIVKKAKQLDITVSNLVREIIESNI